MGAAACGHDGVVSGGPCGCCCRVEAGRGCAGPFAALRDVQLHKSTFISNGDDLIAHTSCECDEVVRRSERHATQPHCAMRGEESWQLLGRIAQRCCRVLDVDLKTDRAVGGAADTSGGAQPPR